jgi:hypothetical protein
VIVNALVHLCFNHLHLIQVAEPRSSLLQQLHVLKSHGHLFLTVPTCPPGTRWAPASSLPLARTTGCACGLSDNPPPSPGSTHPRPPLSGRPSADWSSATCRIGFQWAPTKQHCLLPAGRVEEGSMGCLCVQRGREVEGRTGGEEKAKVAALWLVSAGGIFVV